MNEDSAPTYPDRSARKAGAGFREKNYNPTFVCPNHDILPYVTNRKEGLRESLVLAIAGARYCART